MYWQQLTDAGVLSGYYRPASTTAMGLTLPGAYTVITKTGGAGGGCGRMPFFYFFPRKKIVKFCFNAHKCIRGEGHISFHCIGSAHSPTY